MHVLLIGQQGTGKSTLGRELRNVRGGAFISGGELIRREIAASTSRGRAIQQRIGQGERAPAAITYSLLREALKDRRSEEPVFLDGFPGKASEIPVLRTLMGGPPTRVLLLEGPPTEALVHRLRHRVQCTDCLAPFAGDSRAAGTRCSWCGGLLSGRPEDQTDLKIARRHSFWRETGPDIVGSFEESGLLARLDAGASAREVLNQALRALE